MTRGNGNYIGVKNINQAQKRNNLNQQLRTTTVIDYKIIHLEINKIYRVIISTKYYK